MNKIYEKCLRCGRKLKTEESKNLGFGKICWEKYNNEGTTKKLFVMKGREYEENNRGGDVSFNIDT